MAKSILKIVNFGSAKTGLSTVGYTVYDSNRNIVSARSTSGVGEIGATGIYSAVIGIPDEDAMVIWDTGEATPRYATEDYQSQVNRIQEETDKIQKIWNSLKNQGEFFTTLMDRMGILEKNEGLKKVSDKVDSLAQRDNVSLTNIEEAFKKATKEIKIDIAAPNIPIPDYADKFSDLRNIIIALNRELQKTTKPQKDYDGNFKNILAILSSIQNKESKTLQSVFVLFDDLLKRIQAMQSNIEQMDTKQEILSEIGKVSNYLRQLSKTKDDLNILTAFGHRVK